MKSYSTKQFSSLTAKEIRNNVYNYYRDNLQGKQIVNKDTGITISFNKDGRHKTASLNASIPKSIVICNLLELLKDAKRTKTSLIKKNSSLYRNIKGATLVINFLISCRVDNKVYKFICGIVVTNDGKFQYSLYHNEIVQKK